MATYLYPPTPENVSPAITAPSAAFKKEVSGVLGSIIFFFIVYILLLILSIALVIGCFYAGAAIIINAPRLITIVAGLGLMGVGIMILFFLIKFIFSVSKYDRSGIIEVTEEEQPALFAFIRQLTKETQTKFPKKIYLSPDVNACVFYDSSFWSMFFPVKKNLQIGLGLVNSVNISEFKAVMAHEFGHFSQRSMKLGSFVYNVNKIIYNMLFENKGYAGFLQGWANIDGIFAIFASITAGIAQGIQKILRGMYSIINKKYMSLSREMEFHADAVAASVSGSTSLGTSLRRIELAASGYEITINKCDELFKEKKKSSNIYPNHKSVMQSLAKEFDLPLQNGLPVVTAEFIDSMNLSRINFKDQWASHPSTEERIKHLDTLAVPAEIWEQPSWELFENSKKLQEQLTAKIYEQAQVTEAETINDQVFDEKLNNDILKNTFPEFYKGFYDNRQIAIPTNGLLHEEVTEDIDAGKIFTEENALLIKKMAATTNDLEIVKAIADKRIDAKSFDFEGVKYDRKDADQVVEKLETELKDMQATLEKADADAIRFFIKKAAGSTLRNQYENYFNIRKKADEYLKLIEDMFQPLQPIFMGQSMPVEQIQVLIDQLKDIDQEKVKKAIAEWKQMGAFGGNKVLEERVTNFIGSNYIYFHDNRFLEDELGTLHELSNDTWKEINKYIFERFRSILDQQLKYSA